MAPLRSALLPFLLGAAMVAIAAGQSPKCMCGPNATCTPPSTFDCRCDPGYYGRPPWKQCRPESDPECLDDAACPDNLACIDRLCESPCSRRCPPDLRCTVKNHKATCGPGIYPTPDPPPTSTTEA